MEALRYAPSRRDGGPRAAAPCAVHWPRDC
jgi:hypothetical protein